MGFLLRWLFAFALLALTYNPTGWCFVAWVRGGSGEVLSLQVLAGLLLGVGYIVYLHATLRSIGVFGILLTLAIFGTVLWVAFDQGLMAFDDAAVNTWIGLVVLSLVLAIGLTWSIIRRQLSGQLDVDEIED